MTPQQTIRAILDAATEDNLSKAEDVLRDFATDFRRWGQEIRYGEGHESKYYFNEYNLFLKSQSIKQQPNE